MSRHKNRAFTLVELAVAMTVTLILVVLLANLVNSTSRAWLHGSGQAESFSEARGALNLIGRELEGAVIDSDLGYAIFQTDAKDPNNFILKFLSRRQPVGEDEAGGDETKVAAAVEKVAYQLAWASQALIPEVKGSYDEGHPLPVLIRTANFNPVKGLNDVFDALQFQPDDWVKTWGTLGPGDTVQTGRVDANGDVTEVVAENILGWKVNPIYYKFDAGSSASGTITHGQTVIDDPTSTEALYFDGYITSDLKYLKTGEKADLFKTITPEESPRAIEIRLVALPSNTLPRFLDAPLVSEWKNLRTMDALFKPNDLPPSPFNSLLRKNIQFFDATYYLSSKTP